MMPIDQSLAALTGSSHLAEWPAPPCWLCCDVPSGTVQGEDFVSAFGQHIEQTQAAFAASR